MLTVYGLRSCDTCRAARRWLDEHGIEHRFHDLRLDGLDVGMLERWTGQLDWEKLLNRRSLTWRRIPEADRESVDRERAMTLMLEHPTVVKRPVLERGRFVAVGFSPEGYEKAFGD